MIQGMLNNAVEIYKIYEIISTTGENLKISALSATFAASYATSIDADSGDGTLTGTATGGASISGGWLALTNDDVRYVTYDADLNADSQQIGCIEFDIKPNYSGSPTNNLGIFAISKAHLDVDNMITLFHFNNGQIVFQVADENGVLQINSNMGAWSPIINTSYTFSLNYNFTSGVTRFFIDGTQFGSTVTTTLTRSVSIDLLRVGSNYAGSYKSNYSIRNFRIYNIVLRTEDYSAVPLVSPFNVRISPLSQREQYYANKNNLETTHRMYSTYSAIFDAGDRVVYDTSTYEIIGITNPSEWNKFLQTDIKYVS